LPIPLSRVPWVNGDLFFLHDPG